MPRYNKSQPETIQAMFGSIAKSYDRTNAVLSFQMHKRWNRELVRHATKSNPPETMLDLCCGTGEIAFSYLQHAKHPCNVFMLDFCAEMLLHAKEKAKRLQFNPIHSLSYIKADAQEIPLPSASIACATIAYGIRNVKDPTKCFKEVFRVLQPGGTFAILELTQPSNPILRFGHHIYLRTFLPVLGWCFSANQEAYQYLCNSIHTFIEPEVMQDMLKQAGFEKPTRVSLSAGIATILFAKKST